MTTSVRRPVALLVAAVALGGTAVVAGPAGPAAAAPAVKVARIWFDSPGSDTRTNASLNAEYVVLKNMTTAPRVITGYRLRDANGFTYQFGATRLAAGGTVTLHTGKGTNTATHRYWGKTNYVWNNTTDTATLTTGTGVLVHRCAYPDTTALYRNC